MSKLREWRGRRASAAVVAKMERLAERGQLAAAVGYAQPRALALDDGGLHRALMTLRQRGVASLETRPQTRGAWPPPLPDPLPAATGVPEITAEALSGAVLGGAILHHGSLIVRNLVDPEACGALIRDIDRTFDGADAWIEEGDAAKTDSWFQPYDMAGSEIAIARPWMRRFGGGVFAADCPAMLNRVVDLLGRSKIVDCIGDYLGERPLLSAGKTVLRRVEPTAPGPFHQDGSFLGADVRTVNVWLALNDCGVDAPALELVDRRLDDVLASGVDGADHGWSVSRAAAAEANDGKPFARPAFRAGDALVFDQFMLHATSWSPAMTRRRYAIEAWFFAPSAYTANQVPLVI